MSRGPPSNKPDRSTGIPGSFPRVSEFWSTKTPLISPIIDRTAMRVIRVKPLLARDKHFFTIFNLIFELLTI